MLFVFKKIISFVFYILFVFKNIILCVQKSSRHAAHHAEAAGDGREHGNDEIDDSFQGFLFHSFNFLMFPFFLCFFVSFVFFFPSVPFRSLWKRQNDQMTKWPNDHISRFLALIACGGFKDNRDNRDNFWLVWLSAFSIIFSLFSSLFISLFSSLFISLFSSSIISLFSSMF